MKRPPAAPAYKRASIQRHQSGQPPKFEKTDLGNAQRLVYRHGEEIRYCALWGKYLLWDGGRWRPDDTEEIMQRAKETVRSMYEEAAHIAGDGDEAKAERKAITSWAHQSESHRRITAMVSLAQTEPGIPVRPADLDANLWLLNVANGTINLRDGKLRPADPADLITRRADVWYDASGECPTWDAFLVKVLPDPRVRQFIQRGVGYSLTGSVEEQVLYFLYGTGANGKSTFTETIHALLGDYATKARAETFMRKPDASAIPNDVAALKGARFVTVSELSEGQKLNEGLIKDLTGGDRIQARFLRQEFFDFAPTFKVWMYGNHRPVIRGTDEGIWRRPKLIPFTVRIPDSERDTGLPAKLRAELTGILNWAIRGCANWQVDGLGEPDAVRQATADYRADMDVLGTFISERCIVGDAVRTGATALYLAYKQWCETGGEQCVSQTEFGRRLNERGFEAIRRAGKVLRSGIGLQETDEDLGGILAESRPGPLSALAR